MKKAAFVLISLFSMVSVSMAQNLSITPKQFSLGGPVETESFIGTSTIKNLSSDPNDTAFEWNIISYGLPSSWSSSFCDPKNCYYNLSAGVNHQFDLGINKTNSFIGDFYPQGNAGSGEMKVVVKSKLHPENTDTVIYNVGTWTTGVNTITKTKSLSCYPNPVKDQITINFTAKETVRIDIYNVLGAVVKSFNHDSNNSTINVNDLQKGIYFIRVEDKNNLYTKSFTKID